MTKSHEDITGTDKNRDTEVTEGSEITDVNHDPEVNGNPSIGDPEFLRTDGTDETDDSARVTSVANVNEAVTISLKGGHSDNCMFVLARALKAIKGVEAFSKEEAHELLIVALDKWWSMAKTRELLPDQGDREQFQICLEHSYRSVKVPWGAQPVQIAMEEAQNQPYPPEAKRFTGRTAYLVAVCYQLQQMAGTEPFWLGVRDAQKILKASNLGMASVILKDLVERAILRIETRGTRRRATRFRFVTI